MATYEEAKAALEILHEDWWLRDEVRGFAPVPEGDRSYVVWAYLNGEAPDDLPTVVDNVPVVHKVCPADMRDSRIPGKYVVRAETNRIYEVVQLVQDAGFDARRESMLVLDGTAFFQVNVPGDSKDDLRRLRSVEGVTYVEQEHWMTTA